VLDPGVRQLSEDLWRGGSPARVLRLTAQGRAAWRQLARGPVDSPATGALARRLTDAGMAHPRPPTTLTGADVTVVIPVRDRAALLARCLSALDSPYPVIVVDDGSRDPDAAARVAAERGATLVTRSTNGGAAAARNTGLTHVTTDLVAFVDSDCLPSPGWIDQLVGHFADPTVAAVAPRVIPLAPHTWAGRYTQVASSLDSGDQPARVAPNTRVSYVPTAALVARRSALLTVARRGDVFDPTMSIGEDIDLVWRLHANGWRIRYDPAVHIGHHEPPTWRGLLARRLRYGMSAAPLAVRHRRNLTHLVLHPWPALTVAALLARRPLLAGSAFAASVAAMNRALRANDIPTGGVPRAMATAVGQTWLGIGHYATQFAAPALAALMVPGGRNRWARRIAAGSLLLGPPLVGWARRRPALDPIRYTVAALADDIAYGAGVWAGCLVHRTTTPLRPVVTWRQRRIDSPESENRHEQSLVRIRRRCTAARQETAASVGVRRAHRRLRERHHAEGQRRRVR
jgi:mycofactocin system glycosyltransferase